MGCLGNILWFIFGEFGGTRWALFYGATARFWHINYADCALGLFICQSFYAAL